MTIALVGTAAGGCARPPEARFRVVPQVGPVQPRRVEWSPQDENRLLVMEASGLVGIWDVADPSAPYLFASIPAGAIDARFAPDGRTLVTAGFDGRARSWTVEGRPIAVSSAADPAPARAVAASGNEIVSGGEDGTLRVWHADGSAASGALAGHKGPVVSVAIAPNGDIASAGADGTLRLWKPSDAAPGVAFEPAILFRQNKPLNLAYFMSALRLDVRWGWDHKVVFSPGGDLLAVTLYDGDIRLWNPDGSLHSEIRQAHGTRTAHGLAFSPTGDILASAGFDGTVRLWNFDGSSLGDPIEAHEDVVFAVSFSPHGDRLATTGSDDLVRLWTLDGTRIGELPRGERDPIEMVAVSTHEPVLAIGAHDGTVRVANLAGTFLSEPFATPGGRIASLACSPNGDMVAAGGADGSVTIWGVDGTVRGTPLGARAAPAASIVFHPNDDWVAVGSEAVWLLRFSGLEWRGPVMNDTVTALAFSPSGDVIAAGSLFGRLQARSLTGDSLIEPFKLPREAVRGLVFAPDGGSFATAGGGEDVVRLWNLDGTQQEPPLAGHRGVVTALASSPELSVLASGASDGVVRLWRFPSRDAEEIDVGLPVDQVGFEGRLLWVRAGQDWLFLYDSGRRLVATGKLFPTGLLVFTPDGQFAGPSAASAIVRVFDASGAGLPAVDAARRIAPDRVVAVLDRAAASQ